MSWVGRQVVKERADDLVPENRGIKTEPQGMMTDVKLNINIIKETIN
jgi:hypothetical protein